MGKLARLLHVGITGQIRLQLDRSNFQAGDVIQGTIFLQFKEEVRSKGALELEISGLEKLSWQESDDDHRSTQHKIFEHRMVIAAARETYAAGEYVYPFSYQLLPWLPGNLLVTNKHIGLMKNIRVQVTYGLRARQRVQGFFAADVDEEWEFEVSTAPMARIPRPLERTIDAEVKKMAVIGKGRCQLSAFMDRDVYSPGDKLTVRCSVANQSELNVRKLSTRLYEDFTLRYNGVEGSVSNYLIEVETPEIPAGEFKDPAVTMRLVASQPIQPTTVSHFASRNYHVEVRCAFWFSPSIRLAFPVTIVPPGSVPQATIPVAEAKLTQVADKAK